MNSRRSAYAASISQEHMADPAISAFPNGHRIIDPRHFIASATFEL